MSVVRIDNDNGNDGSGDEGNDNDDNNGDNDADLIDIGQCYFKDLQSRDELNYDSNGFCFVRNQVLLTAGDGVSFNSVKALVNSMNAEIVGYIELTNDYQIEFLSNTSGVLI